MFSWAVLVLVAAFNVFLVAFFLAVLGLDLKVAVVAGAAAVLAFGILGASPLGERLSRCALSLRRPEPKEAEKLGSAYEKVLARAGWPRCRAPGLFLVDDDRINAAAVGSGTVVVATGCLRLPEEELCAVLAHELGHVKHGDADRFRVAAYIGKFDFFLYSLLSLATVFFGSLAGAYAAASGADGEEPPGLFGLLAFWIFLGCKLLGWVVDLLRRPVALAIFAANRSSEYRADRSRQRSGSENLRLVF